ncbi:hypothetical protein [Streptomyces sp. NPDC029674]|uniref:hypothetical protein n=1 Tax=Streptomyces sp. NPDC029674 TaxID=3365297 RepID=UPI00384B69E1
MTSHETEKEKQTETETGPGTGTKTEADGQGAGLTVTTAAFTFLLLRLFAVSGYDWHTAFAVLHTLDLDDTIGLVLGTVMADSFASVLFLALLLPVAVLRLVMEARALREARNRARAAGRRAERPDLAGAMLLLIAVVAVVAYIGTFHSWWVLLLMVGVCGVVLGIGYGVQAGGRLQRAAFWATRHLVALTGLAMLLGAATITTPWVPLERIELGGAKGLRGYVMQAEPGFLKVLTEKEREFLILTDDDVRSREEIAAH